MADFKRTIKCSNCGNESSIYINSELEMSELIVAGKCRCGNTMQVSYSIVANASASSVASTTSTGSSASDSMVNLDDTIFGAPADIPSDTLRSIMDD